MIVGYLLVCYREEQLEERGSRKDKDVSLYCAISLMTVLLECGVSFSTDLTGMERGLGSFTYI